LNIIQDHQRNRTMELIARRPIIMISFSNSVRSKNHVSMLQCHLRDTCIHV